MSAPTTHDHHDHAAGTPEVVEVSGGVFAYVQPDGSWWINNTGFVTGDDAVVAVDTCSTERRTRDLLAAIASRSRHPVRTLVNTHHHGDHTNGNCLVGEATIVGHHRCRDEVLATPIGGLDAIFGPVEWGDLTPAPPTVTFGDRLDVHVGDLRIELHHFADPAHTRSDVVAWLPDRSVLFAGDLVFNGGTPFVLMGSVAGSLAAVERIRALGADTIVPGHGAVCGPEALDAVAGYLRFVSEVADEGRSAGMTPLEAARDADLGSYAELLDAERLVGNLHRAYAELDGTPPGAPIDLLAAFGDMITFNDGRPLRCLA